jgi:thioredoxin reductase
MEKSNEFDVIIVGGSYAGLAAAMALGRALRKVLIIDSGLPCNRQTPYSHNFITNDGRTPLEIATLAREQVEKYSTVKFFQGLATQGTKTEDGFEIQTDSGKSFGARKIIFATGIRDIMPNINGFAACWGISVLHCPYCHGYEVRGMQTGILGNGEPAVEFCKLISNWTNNLTLFTNGKSTLTEEQTALVIKHGIKIVEQEIAALKHNKGYLEQLVFKDGSFLPIQVLYTRCSFEQHCSIPISLGCLLTEDGYLKTDLFQETSVSGVFACGDNATRMRAVAQAVAMGTMAGAAVNKQMINEEFT